MPTPDEPATTEQPDQTPTPDVNARARERTDDQVPPTGAPTTLPDGQTERPSDNTPPAQDPADSEDLQRWGVSHPWRAIQLADGTTVDHHGTRLTPAQVDKAREVAESVGLALEHR